MAGSADGGPADRPTAENRSRLMATALGAHKQGDLRRAEVLYRKILAEWPDHDPALARLGLIAYHHNHHQAALDLIGKAVTLNAAEPSYHANLGIVLETLGRLDAAHRQYRRAISLKPDFAAAHHNLAQIKTFTEGDADLLALRRAVAVGEGETPAPGLNFALGKAEEDLGHYDQAFAAYQQANRSTRENVPYDRRHEEAEFHALAEAFPPKILQRLSAAGVASRRPIFVLGMPRSGTTLVEQILASHSRVLGGGERRDLGRLAAELATPAANARGLAEAVARLSRDDCRRLGETYLAKLDHGSPDKHHTTDKMPLNFRLIGLIHLILPQAPIIHVSRDPRDTCFSCYARFFTEANAFSYDLQDLAHYYRHYSALMARWHRLLPSGRIYTISYEALIDDPDGEVRKLLDHCGLPWEDRCLEFHRTARAVKTASAGQVRKPLYRRSLGRWERFAPYLEPLVASLRELVPHNEADLTKKE